MNQYKYLKVEIEGKGVFYIEDFNIDPLIKGYFLTEKEYQRKLLSELMRLDEKDGFYKD